jgi:hypothetical protein
MHEGEDAGPYLACREVEELHVGVLKHAASLSLLPSQLVQDVLVVLCDHVKMGQSAVIADDDNVRAAAWLAVDRLALMLTAWLAVDRLACC